MWSGGFAVGDVYVQKIIENCKLLNTVILDIWSKAITVISVRFKISKQKGAKIKKITKYTSASYKSFTVGYTTCRPTILTHSLGWYYSPSHTVTLCVFRVENTTLGSW